MSYTRKTLRPQHWPLQHSIWWREKDSNLRRLSRQIYSLFPLTAWVSLRKNPRLSGRLHPLSTPKNRKAGIAVFDYGSFLTIVVNFIILAFIIFMMVKQMNRLRKAEEAAPAPEAPAPTPEDIVLLREIRDSLKR